MNAKTVIVLTHPIADTPPARYIFRNKKDKLSATEIWLIEIWRDQLKKYWLGKKGILFLMPHRQKPVEMAGLLSAYCNTPNLLAYQTEPTASNLIETINEHDPDMAVVLVTRSLFCGICVDLHHEIYNRGAKYVFTRQDLSVGAICVFDRQAGDSIISLG
jgi:hypothetical protein